MHAAGDPAAVLRETRFLGGGLSSEAVAMPARPMSSPAAGQMVNHSLSGSRLPPISSKSSDGPAASGIGGRNAPQSMPGMVVPEGSRLPQQRSFQEAHHQPALKPSRPLPQPTDEPTASAPAGFVPPRALPTLRDSMTRADGTPVKLGARLMPRRSSNRITPAITPLLKPALPSTPSSSSLNGASVQVVQPAPATSAWPAEGGAKEFTARAEPSLGGAGEDEQITAV